MKKSQIVVLLLLLAAALSSCCNCRKKVVDNKAFAATYWTLEQIGSKSAEGMLPEGETMPRIIFNEDNSFGGYAGCNSMGGQYEVVPNKEAAKDGSISGALKLMNPFTTKRMCPNAAMERQLIGALLTIDSYTIEGDRLFLLSDGELQLVFVAK